MLTAGEGGSLPYAVGAELHLPPPLEVGVVVVVVVVVRAELAVVGPYRHLLLLALLPIGQIPRLLGVLSS